MEKLNYMIMAGKRYELPEGYYALEDRFSFQVYEEETGKNVTSKIMGDLKGEGYILLTNKGNKSLKLLEKEGK